MWDQPRPDTEAYKVKQEAERRKKIAKQKGLDKLLSAVYHDTINHYPAWITNQRNKRWVLPEVVSANKLEKFKEKKSSLDGVEFVIGNKNYKITEEKRYNNYVRGDDSTYCDIDLYLNDKKIFAISESVHYGEWATDYSPFSVNAYASDEWVEDFIKIKEHYEAISKQSQIEFAEDPKRTQALKEAFNINDLPNDNSVSEEKDHFNPQPSGVIANRLGMRSAKPKKSIWSKWWFWAIVIVVIWIILSSQ